MACARECVSAEYDAVVTDRCAWSVRGGQGRERALRVNLPRCAVLETLAFPLLVSWRLLAL